MQANYDLVVWQEEWLDTLIDELVEEGQVDVFNFSHPPEAAFKEMGKRLEEAKAKRKHVTRDNVDWIVWDNLVELKRFKTKDEADHIDFIDEIIEDSSAGGDEFEGMDGLDETDVEL